MITDSFDNKSPAIINPVKKVWLFPINSVLIFRFPFFCHNNIEDKTFYP